MATSAVPDGVVVEVAVRAAVGATDSSPSQERLTRIAAMLRHAEQSMPGAPERGTRHRRDRPEPRMRRAS